MVKLLLLLLSLFLFESKAYRGDAIRVAPDSVVAAEDDPTCRIWRTEPFY